MTPRKKALRAQDIQTGLQAIVDIPGIVEAEVETTLVTGMACRLATHIRGVDVFEEEDIPRLKHVAKSLGIPALSLSAVLDYLQETGFVKVRRTSGGSIKTVRESVPEYGDLYTSIGDIYDTKDKTEIEEALLQTYDQVVTAPRIDDSALPINSIKQRHRDALLDVAAQSALIKAVHLRRSGQDLLYSPQYWDENAEKIGQVVDAYGNSTVQHIIKRVSSSQGTPITSIRTEEGKILRVLATTGILPSPSVKGVSGEVAFAFTPFKLDAEDKPLHAKIMEKTRAIIACVRYGQAFAKASSIRSPVILLNALKNRKQIGPHSEIFQQYELLITQGIARIHLDRITGRFTLHLIDTVENMRALQASIEILESGTPFSVTYIDDEVKNYAMNGNYDEPPTARAKQIYNPSSQALKAIHDEVIEVLVNS
jgi:hypothetical protein